MSVAWRGQIPSDEDFKLSRVERLDHDFLGSEAERALCEEVARAGGPACRNLAGSTVEEALALLSACRAAVGGDSGLTHAARALRLPVATLFGPTSPARHERGTRDVFVSLGLPCSPCAAPRDPQGPAEPELGVEPL